MKLSASICSILFICLALVIFVVMIGLNVLNERIDIQHANTADANKTELSPSLIDLTRQEKLGHFHVLSQDGLVTIVANQASRIEIIRQLAKTFGFQFTTNGIVLGTATLQIENITLEKALSELIYTSNFIMRYAFDSELNKHTLTYVALGNRETSQQPTIKASAEAHYDNYYASPELGPPVASIEHNEAKNYEPTEMLDFNVDQHLIEREMLGYELDSVSADDRILAITSLAPHGDGFDTLVGVLKNDLDPTVREAAVQQLSSDDSFASTSALLEALSDTDTNVVFRALEGLIDTRDRSVIPHIEAAILDHPNQYVRASVSNISQAFDVNFQMRADE